MGESPRNTNALPSSDLHHPVMISLLSVYVTRQRYIEHFSGFAAEFGTVKAQSRNPAGTNSVKALSIMKVCR